MLRSLFLLICSVSIVLASLAGSLPVRRIVLLTIGILTVWQAWELHHLRSYVQEIDEVLIREDRMDEPR